MKPKLWIPILVALLALSTTSIALAFPAEGVYRNFADIVVDDEPTETPEPTATMEPTSTPEMEEHIEFEGEVEAVNGDGSYVIAGQTVLTDENTHFEPNAEAVAIGVWVEVKAVQEADGSLLALKIEVKDREYGDDEHGAKVEFQGTVEAIDGNAYTIAGQVVMVSADTVFKPDQASITVGAWVKVEALTLSDGSLLARKIELKHAGEPGDDEVERMEFRGVVEAMDGNFITVAGMMVDVSTAVVKDGTLQVGVVVEVEAKRMADGSIVAIEIEVKGSTDDDDDTYRPHVEFEGVVEAINGSVYIVGGVTVDASSAAIEHGPIGVGDKVKVEGVEQPDGSVLAIKIHKVTGSEEAAEVEFTATVTAMGGGTVTFDNGLTVVVDGNTMIDEGHGPLRIGVRAKVKAQDQGGMLLALRIKVKGDD